MAELNREVTANLVRNTVDDFMQGRYDKQLTAANLQLQLAEAARENELTYVLQVACLGGKNWSCKETSRESDNLFTMATPDLSKVIVFQEDIYGKSVTPYFDQP